MVKHRGKFKAMLLAGTLALMIPAAVSAQSRVEDFRLPEPSQTSDVRQPDAPQPDARQQGPVDADAPVVQPRAREAGVPSQALPQPDAPQPPATADTATTAASPVTARARARRTPDIGRPAIVPSAASASPAAPEALPTESPAPLPADEAAAPPAAPAPQPSGDTTPGWLHYALGAGGLALLLALALIFAPRRSKHHRPAHRDRQHARQSTPSPAPPERSELAQEPRSTPPTHDPAKQTPPVAEPAAPAILPGQLTVSLDVQRLSATMLNAALTYRLTVHNHAQSDICEVTLFADMTSAHGSLGGQEQLLITSEDIRPLHNASRLAPGEAATFKGELRLPLAQVLPIHSGKAVLFVPLLRLRVESGSGDQGNRRVSHHAFVIGQLPLESGSALRPFQLELGPRIYSEIGQRELALDGLVSSR